MAILSKIIFSTAVCLVAGQDEMDEENHGHMHADGSMHFGNHDDEMYGDDEGEGFDNPDYDPDYVLTNEEFVKMTPDEFWNKVLPKLDHSKLDDIINTLDKDHLQKMISSMPGMEGHDMDMDGYGDDFDFGEDDDLYGEDDEADLEAENDAEEEL